MSEYRILVAEDDPVMAATLSGALESRGYGVIIARDAMQAVMFAVQQQPKAILLDVNMPAGTGLGALKRLQASTRTSSIPVLVVSGSTDLTLPATVRAEGAKGFFKKPVDLDALCARLEELLPSPSRSSSPAANG
ncbi:MAG TPA: response regulator [Gemmatimonadaceae bacterium]|nr:response regulator [Gemmatimonadaceae bacterium]